MPTFFKKPFILGLTIGLSLVLTIIGNMNVALGLYWSPRAHWPNVALTAIHMPAIFIGIMVSGNPHVPDPIVFRVVSFFTYCAIIGGVITLVSLLRSRKRWWPKVQKPHSWTVTKRFTVRASPFILSALTALVSSFIVFMYWYDDFRYIFYESGPAAKFLAGLAYHATWLALLVMCFRTYRRFQRGIQKRRVLVLYGFLALFYLSSAFFLHLYLNRFTNEPDDYMGIKWGTPLNMFVRPHVPPWLEGINSTDIDYLFYDDKFAAALIRVSNKGDWLRLKEYCFKTYGPALDRGKREALLEHSYRWRGNKTMIFLGYWKKASQTPSGIAYYSAESYMREIRSHGKGPKVKVRALK